MTLDQADGPIVKRLMTSLKIPQWQAVGLLETFRLWAKQYAKDGGVGKWTDFDIASAIDWKSTPKSLITHLLKAEYLKVDKEHRLIIVDWSSKCEDATHMWLAREIKMFVDGSIPIKGLKRIAVKDRVDLVKRWMDKFGPDVFSVQELEDLNCAHLVRTKSALPVPSNQNQKQTTVSPSASFSPDPEWERVAIAVIEQSRQVPKWETVEIELGPLATALGAIKAVEPNPDVVILEITAWAQANRIKFASTHRMDPLSALCQWFGKRRSDKGIKPVKIAIQRPLLAVVDDRPEQKVEDAFVEAKIAELRETGRIQDIDRQAERELESGLFASSSQRGLHMDRIRFKLVRQLIANTG